MLFPALTNISNGIFGRRDLFIFNLAATQCQNKEFEAQRPVRGSNN